LARLPTGSDRSDDLTRQRRQGGPQGASPCLTRREIQVLALIGGGLTTAQIANRLRISAKTVESRRQTLFAKLGVQNQSHAVAVAIRTGLLANGSGQPGSG
jgi:DNA-binding CsgD family transcriptional regulator